MTNPPPQRVRFLCFFGRIFWSASFFGFTFLPVLVLAFGLFRRLPRVYSPFFHSCRPFRLAPVRWRPLAVSWSFFPCAQDLGFHLVVWVPVGQRAAPFFFAPLADSLSIVIASYPGSHSDGAVLR